MIIAVNTRFLIQGRLEGMGYFVKEVFSRIAQQHPEHQFYFFFDRPHPPEFVFSKNVTPLVLSPPARHPLLWKYWFDVKVPLTLRKIKADVFVSTDGFASLTTRVPQCLILHDLGFLHHPHFYQKSHLLFLNRFTPAFVKKSKRIATVSQFSRADIMAQYPTDSHKIDVVYSAAKSIFHPLSVTEKTAAKEKYTGGTEYFIYAGAIQPRKNLVNLLKAFSLFKKRQRSNWKLVLAGRLAWKNDAFLELLKTYKYRQDVVLTGYIEEAELVSLMGAAYALVYPSFFEGFGVPVLEAMKCEVPALTSKDTSMQEIAGEAALYFDPADPSSIAEQLMRIYKDESLRHQLIEKGKKVADSFNWQRTADLVWNSILKTAG